ncbi:MAG: hypothetical protein REH83_04335 [Rickettsiella sp.]|nr:hypothetical protein [Rickettsiella sp.]
MATANANQLKNQHFAGITLIKEDLKEKVSKLLNIKNFIPLLDENFTEKLTKDGKNIIAAGLNPEALSTAEEEIKNELRKQYNAALMLGESLLKQGFDPKTAVSQAQIQFKKSIENARSKETLFQSFISELAKKKQAFSEEDKTHLRDVFFQFLDNTIHKHNESLKDFQSLESVKASLKLDDENMPRNSNASMTARELNKDKLNIGPKVQTVPGYGVNIDNLRKQLKHALANLKPGEKINIEVTKPQRDELEKNIAETGLQYRNPLLAMLLLLYLHLIHFSRIPFLRINKDNDEKRVLKVLQDLAKKDGLFLDPKDLNLKISVTAKDGKKQTILEGPLSEPLANELNNTAAKVRESIFSDNKPLNNSQSLKPTPTNEVKTEEEQEEKVNTPRPRFYGR